MTYGMSGWIIGSRSALLSSQVAELELTFCGTAAAEEAEEAAAKRSILIGAAKLAGIGGGGALEPNPTFKAQLTF
jgi:hypothetical protein